MTDRRRRGEKRVTISGWDRTLSEGTEQVRQGRGTEICQEMWLWPETTPSKVGLTSRKLSEVVKIKAGTLLTFPTD